MLAGKGDISVGSEGSYDPRVPPYSESFSGNITGFVFHLMIELLVQIPVSLANNKQCGSAVLVLGQLSRQWTNIKVALAQCWVF